MNQANRDSVNLEIDKKGWGPKNFYFVVGLGDLCIKAGTLPTTVQGKKIKAVDLTCIRDAKIATSYFTSQDQLTAFIEVLQNLNVPENFGVLEKKA